MTSLPRAILLLGVLALAGCADVDKESTPAVPDKPQPGKALVYFYRVHRYVGWARGIEIDDGTTPIGDLSNGSYFVFQASPGLHHFVGNGHDEDSVSYPLAPNHTYYFRCGIEMGMWLPHYPVESVMGDQASAEMATLQRVHWEGN
jgi:hypothetical protein